MRPVSSVCALLLLAVAAALPDGRAGRGRLRRLACPPSAAVPPPPLRPVWVAVGAGTVALVLGSVSGPGAALLGAALTAVAGVLATRRLRGRGERADEDAVVLAGRWPLLAVCLESGLPVVPAVEAAAAPLAGAAGQALRSVAGLLLLGADPAAAWATVADRPALAAFARAAARSAGTGAALAQVARTEGARLRAELADTAQARAQRAAVLLAGPLGLCFLPAFVVLGIAPVVIGLASQALAQW